MSRNGRVVVSLMSVVGLSTYALGSPGSDMGSVIAGIPAPDIAHFTEDYAEKNLGPNSSPALYVAVVDGTGARYVAAFGSAGPASRKATAEQPLRIASQTKLFTALAVLSLVDAGRMHLDDSIESYLGGYRIPRVNGLPDDTKAPTIRELLSHASGLSNIKMVHSGFRSGEKPPDLAHMIPESGPVLERTPGQSIAYTNADYTLLGRAIEVVSGLSYETFIQRSILEPLEMRHSNLVLDGRMRGMIAQGVITAGPDPGPYLIDSTFTRPSGDLISSPQDMANFLQMWLSRGKFNDRQAIAAGAVDALTSGCFTAKPELAGWCLGPERDVKSGFVAYSHSGDHLSYNTALTIIPSRGVAIWAGNISDQLVAFKYVEAFMRRFFGDAAFPPRASPAKAMAGLTSAVAGTYRTNAPSLGRSARFFELLLPGIQFEVQSLGPNSLQVKGISYEAISPTAFQILDARIAQEPLASLYYGYRVAFDPVGSRSALVYFDHGSATRVPWWDVRGRVEVSFLFALAIAFIVPLILLWRKYRGSFITLTICSGTLWLVSVSLMLYGLATSGHEILFGWPPLFRVGEILLTAAMFMSGVSLVDVLRSLHHEKPGAASSIAPALAGLFMILVAIHWQFVPS